jgi:hypothetical protein
VLDGDGCHLAYAAERGAKRIVVADGVEGPEYDDIGKIIFAPNGRLAYSALLGAEWRVVSDGAVRPGL